MSHNQPQRHSVSTSGGVLLALDTFGGSESPTLLLAHATGFCKEGWLPFVEELRACGVENRAVAWDYRGHGSSEPARAPTNWEELAGDVLAVVDTRAGDEPLLLVGHSMGAGTGVLAELERPGTFTGMVLVEPIIYPRPQGRRHHEVADAALRRKHAFRSRREAREHFARKAAFARWDGRALDAYIRGGFRQDGSGVVLACAPEMEAGVFRTSFSHDAHRRLGELDLPVLIVAGEDSETHPRPFVEDLAGRILHSRLQVIAGAGHLVPMEQPRALAQAVAEWFGDLGWLRPC
jgi:pimeloyl-ACP methyl ester carboxylesterase